MFDYVLGIDSSTQGTTGVVLELGSFRRVVQARVRYRDDPRLEEFKLGSCGGAPILTPREPGEADQPAALFLAALDSLFSDLPREVLGRLAAIDLSAQQHGQVWLGPAGAEAIEALREEGAGSPGAPRLARRIGPGLASDRAPIWMSANAALEAAEIREALGGPEEVCAASGSDSPLRFSGAVLRRRAKAYPELYERTWRFHLISSFLSGVLAGNSEAPIDWGNGSGTSLMDWSRRRWSPELLAAVSTGLPGGSEGLASRLPELCGPLEIIGRAAAYFRERYGLPADCAIVAGSGDNPQSKVLASGALLSLGTSFVLMAEGSRPHVSANAMYDGLGRPFLFGCRTNGALAWEAVRVRRGLRVDDFAASERALASFAPGAAPMRIYQPETESFPFSPALDFGPRTGGFEAEYAGTVDSSLGLMALASAPFAGALRDIAVTGGAAASRGVLERVAALWGARVTPIEESGAAAGAAVAAACALVPESERYAIAESARAVAARPGTAVLPDPGAVEAARGEGGYLERLKEAFADAIA